MEQNLDEIVRSAGDRPVEIQTTSTIRIGGITTHQETTTTRPDLDESLCYSIPFLARMFQVSEPGLRKHLGKDWRREHFSDFEEVSNKAKNTAALHFRLRAVLPIIRAMQRQEGPKLATPPQTPATPPLNTSTTE